MVKLDAYVRRRRRYKITGDYVSRYVPGAACTMNAFYSAQFQITVFGSIWFSRVMVGHGFINCLPSESFVVSFSLETENLMEKVLRFLSNR